jgi:hypothetical protein
MENDMNASRFDFALRAERLSRHRRLFETARAAARVATAGVLVCALAGSTPRASANEPLVDQHDFLNAPANSSDSSNEQLEKFFWMCDYAASAGGLDAAQIEPCRVVTAHLKQVRFGGDSDAFVAWSLANRAMAHQQLAVAGSAQSCPTESWQTEARS